MSVSSTKQLIKQALIGAFEIVESEPRRYPGALSTLYHEVEDDPADYRISGQVFAGQVEYLLAQGARWHTATELADGLRELDASNSVCVTFDDGDHSAFEPTLQLVESGGKCTHFMIPERIESKHGRTMSWEQTLELDAAGVEIGSHSLSHAHLTRSSDSELARELSVSKNILEDKLGKAVTSFAYPYGEFDDRVVNQVREQGYRCAFTTWHVYALPADDPFRLPRFEPLKSIRQLEDLWQGRAHRFYSMLRRYLELRSGSKL